MNCVSKAAIKGTTSQHTKVRTRLNPASKEAKGPTKPTTPNPADDGVPEIENSATGIAEITALTKHGTRMIGFRNRLGIIIFIAPSAMAIVTPGLLTLHEFTTKTIVVAATPIAAAPAETPFNWIAIPIATVEIGEMIKKAKEQPIKIDINRGCSVVKLLINVPIAEVIAVT